MPLAPVVQYILNNAEILSWIDAVAVFCVFALLASVAIMIVPILVQHVGSTRPVMYLGVAFAFSITNMATLSSHFAWHEKGSLKVQLLIFGSVWLASWLFFRMNLRRLMHVMIAAIFVSNSA